jgi:hypothetical protein
MSSEQTLGSITVEAVKIWHQMRANGASISECTVSMEAVIRERWPFKREWKFLCANCDDVGLVMAECSGDATCGRAREHGRHTFGTPCWCPLGNKFRDKGPAPPEDFAQAGRVKKPTRFGR